MFVALPGIHGVANGARATFQRRLTKSEIRFAAERAQLHEPLRLQRRHEIEGKRDMVAPGTQAVFARDDSA